MPRFATRDQKGDQVGLWRTRQVVATAQLEAAAAKKVSDQKWVGFITQILTEEPRPGTPKFFITEDDANSRVRL